MTELPFMDDSAKVRTASRLQCFSSQWSTKPPRAAGARAVRAYDTSWAGPI